MFLHFPPDRIARRLAPATSARRAGCGHRQMRRIAPAMALLASGDSRMGSRVVRSKAVHGVRVEGSAPATAVGANVAPQAAGLRVLLAEDDPMVARSTVSVLRRLGHSVTHALDGVAAWKQLENRLHEFDVLLLDVVMPRMNGSELAHRARAAGFNGQIVLISGLLMSIDPDALRLLGIRSFMTKPFLPADLERALRG